MRAQNQNLVKMKEIIHFFNRYPSKHKVSWQLIIGFFGVSTFVRSRCAYTARRDSKMGHKTKLATDGLLALGKAPGTTFPAQLATRGTIHGDVVGICMTAVHQVKANGAGYVFLGSEMIPNFKPFTWAAMIPRPAKDGYVNLKTMLLICVYITDCREY